MVIEVAVEASAEVAVGAVVPEVSATPEAAVEADAEVAPAVVDAAIVADAQAPVAGIPAVEAVIVAPVAGGPESAVVGRENPGAVDPVVGAAVPGPVAGRPHVAVAGAFGLVVDGNGGRCDPGGDDDCSVRLRGGYGYKCRGSDGGCYKKVAKCALELHGDCPSGRLLVLVAIAARRVRVSDVSGFGPR